MACCRLSNPSRVRQKFGKFETDRSVTVDLEEQKIFSPVKRISFEIDQDWKQKLLNGLDDIGLHFSMNLIAAYEKNRPAYWQW